MKPTKAKKKVMSESNPSSSIQNYFKNASKQVTVKSLYVQALTEKLKNSDGEKDPQINQPDSRQADKNDTTSISVKATERVKSKTSGCDSCDEWRLKYDEVKKSHITLSVRHTDILMKYDALLKLVTNNRNNTEERFDLTLVETDYTTVCDATSETVSGTVGGTANTLTVGDTTKTRTINHTATGTVGDTATGTVGDTTTTVGDTTTTVGDTTTTVGDTASGTLSCDYFTENEVKCLQCVPLQKKKDSTFILQCIEYAYKDNAATLCTKSLKGTSDRVEVHDDGTLTVVRPGKNPLTPPKVKEIQKLFIDRVSKSKCLGGEFAERVKLTNINKLIGAAVKNVANKEKPKTAMSSQNTDLF